MESDIFYMNQALELAKKGRLSTAPNPWVGCVLVKNGLVVGRGYHEAPGKPHAEIMAIAEAKENAAGSTAYVTLEPCNHYGRTPPCTKALIDIGIKRVVVPFIDPDGKVQGQGIDFLKENGIEVSVGICQKEATELLEPYLHHRKTGLPFCVLKSASSLDGRTAASNGSSQWITSAEAREDVQKLRAESQAILVGSQTAIKDNPRLTSRYDQVFKQPLRVVLDGSGSVFPEGNLFDLHLAPTLLFTSEKCPASRIELWKSKGVEVEVVNLDEEGKVSLIEVLKNLGKRGILQLIVEGGSLIHGSFLRQNLWDRFVLYLGACVLGPHGTPLINSVFPDDIKKAPRWKICEMKQLADDLKIIYRPL